MNQVMLRLRAVGPQLRAGYMTAVVRLNAAAAVPKHDPSTVVIREGRPVTKFYGLSIEGLKTNYPLIPLLASLAAGVIMAALYVYRLTTNNIDVTWNKAGVGHEPWQKEIGKQWKVLNFTIDYNNLNPEVTKAAALSRDLLAKTGEAALAARADESDPIRRT